MHLINRYIARNIYIGTILVLLVLVGLESFIQFISQMHAIGTKDFGLLAAFEYVPLTLPQHVYELFPLAGLIGSLMGLGWLASNNELVVMRASGVSIAQVTVAVIKAALIMLVVVTLIGEWVAPKLVHAAEMKKALAMSGGQALKTQHGIWLRDGDNYIHISTVTDDGVALGVTRFQFDSARHLQVASFAKSGRYRQGQWVFNDISQTRLFGSHDDTSHFKQKVWHIKLDPHLLGVAQVSPDQKTLLQLHRYINYRENSGLQSDNYVYHFWRRVFQPLASLVMICLAIPFVFGPLRSASMGLRILTGAVFALSFYMLNQFFGPISMVYQFPPILAAALPTLLFAGIGCVILWLKH